MFAHLSPNTQYFGKWPFTKFFYMQEPASVLFSLMNLVTHVQGLRRIGSVKGFKYRWLLMTVSLSGILAWVSSMIFHARDKPATEKLDYFSAALYILLLCSYGVVRVFRLEKPGILSWAALAGTFYLSHISYLTFVTPFNYDYNITACLCLGLLSLLIWAYYAYTSLYPQKLAILRCFGLLFLGTALEIFDFPPIWGVFDAHSIWHLYTVFITPLFYDFFRGDALWFIQNVQKVRKED